MYFILSYIVFLGDVTNLYSLPTKLIKYPTTITITIILWIINNNLVSNSITQINNNLVSNSTTQNKKYHLHHNRRLDSQITIIKVVLNCQIMVIILCRQWFIELVKNRYLINNKNNSISLIIILINIELDLKCILN